MIVMNEDGDLALARLGPTGAEILSRAKSFRHGHVDGADARGHDVVRA
jgi:hypothetical protein